MHPYITRIHRRYHTQLYHRFVFSVRSFRLSSHDVDIECDFCNLYFIHNVIHKNLEYIKQQHLVKDERGAKRIP